MDHGRPSPETARELLARNMSSPTRVLIADDDPSLAQELARSLTHEGYACEVARSRSDALGIMSRARCDVAICCVRGGEQSDFGLLDQLRQDYPPLPVIVLSARPSTAQAVDAIKHGAFQYLPVPCPLPELVQHIEHGVESCEVGGPSGEEVVQDALVSTSVLMARLMETVALVARSTAPVLILGESGTGKERIARAIHAWSTRAAGPFVAVNTTAIPEALLESELFGHVKGAYTGATQTRPGLFAEAEGGTLLLDEIGDMPQSMQPKLLRALQFGEVRAVGSDRTRRINVRILAATHRDLGALVAENRFRDDLRYRLNTICLRIPPLRERREDIPTLVQHFLAAARSRAPNSPVTTVDADAMRLLAQAPWPGNVRELESAVERLVVLGTRSTVTPQELAFLEPCAEPAAHAWLQRPEKAFTMRQMNQHYLSWMLRETKGDKARAAQLLGIDLSTVYRWQRDKE